ncbi:6827_t:CDS:2, partial [Paraglomus brasilianum]
EKRAEIENYYNNDGLKGDYNMLKLLLTANTSRGPSVNRGSDEIDRAMTDDEIRGLLLEVLTAAIETSASLMCFVVYLVGQNPEVKKKIQDEVDPLFRDDPTRKLQLDDLNNLPYIEAVIKEASRLLPPGPINYRVASHEDDIGGYRWKAGTQFMIDVVGIQTHSAHWSCPEKFIPERFLSQSKDIVKNSIQTFGGGLRICPGRQYAMFLMKIVLASLYNRYDIELANENEKPATTYKVTLYCQGLKVKMRRRNIV